MATSKRKAPEKAPVRKRQPSLAARIASAAGGFVFRYPRVIAGLAIFGVVFSVVSANALWYQPRKHPFPLLATRMQGAENRAVNTDEGSVSNIGMGANITTFKIERQADQPAEVNLAAKPVADPLIRNIQTALSARGLYNGPSDGLSGPKTTAAILFYQQTEGLAETGEPTPELLARMQKKDSAVAVIPDERPSMDVTASTKKTDDVASLIESAENTALPVPEQKPVSPELVMQIQKALAGMAYKDIKVDGICGDATRTAIRAFEKSYRMTVTGEPSEKLLKKLKSIGAA